MEHDDADEIEALAAADPVDLDAVPAPDRALFEEIIMEPVNPIIVRPSRKRALIAGVALVAVAGVGGGAIALSNDGKAADPPGTEAPTTDPTPGKVAGIEPAPRTGQFGAAAMAMCMVWDVSALDDADFAFDGTVTEIDNGWVTFEVGEWFSADQGGIVVLNAEGLMAGPDGGPVSSEGVVMITEVGQRFLVSGIDGSAGICNMTQPYDAAEAEAWRGQLGG